MEGITYLIKNREILMAETFRKKAESFKEQAQLLKMQNHHEEAEEMNQRAEITYGEEAYCRKRSAELLFNLSTIERNIAETADKKYPKKNNDLEKHHKESIKLFREAAREYDAAQMRFNDLADYYEQQSRALKTQGRNEESRKIFEEAEMADQKSKNILKNQGHWYTKYAELLFNLGKMHAASDVYGTAATKLYEFELYCKKRGCFKKLKKHVKIKNPASHNIKNYFWIQAKRRHL